MWSHLSCLQPVLNSSSEAAGHQSCPRASKKGGLNPIVRPAEHYRSFCSKSSMVNAWTCRMKYKANRNLQTFHLLQGLSNL